MKRLSVLLAVLAWSVTTMTVLATPGTGVVPADIARATFAAPIDSDQDAGLQSVIQQLTIAPGGHTGWHTHPGGTVILVQSGTFTIYNDSCVGASFAAGSGAFEQGGHVQLARNEGTADLVLTVVYFDVPVGGPVRTDAATPACAVGDDPNALPEGAAGSGVTFPAGTTSGIIGRNTFAAGGNVDQAANRDTFVQLQTYALGGHSGWHSHPGATVVYVESGELSLYMTDCVEMTVGAGQGVIEPPNTTMLARNEGTVPVVLRVAYFDVPVGGPFRIDQPEPSTCPGLAAVPTVAPSVSTLPNTAAAEASGSMTPGVLPILLLVIAGASGVGLALAYRRRTE